MNRTTPQDETRTLDGIRQPRWHQWIFFGALALALGLRLYHLGEQDFWQDEIHSMYNSAGARGPVEELPHGVILKDLPRYSDLTEQSTLSAVWRTMDDDGHPPLFFVLLLLWRRLVGDAEYALRGLSVAFSVLSIIPVALLARELRRPRLAPHIALLLALCYTHILMGQENRPYALSFLFVATSFWLVVRMERRWTDWSKHTRLAHCAFYAATIFLAVMTHYFSLLALAGQGCYALHRLRGQVLRWWLLSVVTAAGLFAIVWLPHLVHQREFIASQNWLLEKHPDHAQRSVLRIAAVPIQHLFLTERIKVVVSNSLTGFALLSGVCVVLWVRRTRDATVFVYWYFVPVVILAAVDFTTQHQLLTHLRYGSTAIPGLVGMIALAIDELSGKQDLVVRAHDGRQRFRGLAVLTGLVGVMALTLRLPAQENPQSRVAAAILKQDITRDSLLVYDAIDWPSIWALRLFQLVSYYLPYNPPTLLLRDRPDEALKNEMARYDRIYVVSPPVEDLSNHTRETHPYVEVSDYIFEVGWVYRCMRKPPAAAMP